MRLWLPLVQLLVFDDDDAENDAHTFVQSSVCDDNEKCWRMHVEASLNFMRLATRIKKNAPRDCQSASIFTDKRKSNRENLHGCWALVYNRHTNTSASTPVETHETVSIGVNVCVFTLRIARIFCVSPSTAGKMLLSNAMYFHLVPLFKLPSKWEIDFLFLLLSSILLACVWCFFFICLVFFSVRVKRL